MSTYEKIKQLCEDAGFSISAISKKIPGLSVSRASITGWKNGSKPRPDKILMIAEFFDVDPDYLTNDDILEIHTIHDNHGVIGKTNSSVTVNNKAADLGEIETEIISICKNLNLKNKVALLEKAYELKEKES